MQGQSEMTRDVHHSLQNPRIWVLEGTIPGPLYGHARSTLKRIKAGLRGQMRGMLIALGLVLVPSSGEDHAELQRSIEAEVLEMAYHRAMLTIKNAMIEPAYTAEGATAAKLSAILTVLHDQESVLQRQITNIALGLRREQITVTQYMSSLIAGECAESCARASSKSGDMRLQPEYARQSRFTNQPPPATSSRTRRPLTVDVRGSFDNILDALGEMRAALHGNPMQ